MQLTQENEYQDFSVKKKFFIPLNEAVKIIQKKIDFLS